MADNTAQLFKVKNMHKIADYGSYKCPQSNGTLSSTTTVIKSINKCRYFNRLYQKDSASQHDSEDLAGRNAFPFLILAAGQSAQFRFQNNLFSHRGSAVHEPQAWPAASLYSIKNVPLSFISILIIRYNSRCFWK